MNRSQGERLRLCGCFARPGEGDAAKHYVGKSGAWMDCSDPARGWTDPAGKLLQQAVPIVGPAPKRPGPWHYLQDRPRQQQRGVIKADTPVPTEPFREQNWFRDFEVSAGSTSSTLEPRRPQRNPQQPNLASALRPLADARPPTLTQLPAARSQGGWTHLGGLVGKQTLW